MKIAVFHNLPSGGGKRALHGYVKYLRGNGHMVDAYMPSTANEDFLPLKDVASGVAIYPVARTMMGMIYSTVHYVPPVWQSLRDLELVQKNIAEDINSRDYDVVLSEQDRSTMAPFLLKYVRKPMVFYCQQPFRFDEKVVTDIQKKAGLEKNMGFVERYMRRTNARKLPLVEKHNASFAKYILANSNFSRENILRAYGKEAHVSYLGVDTDIFKPLWLKRENIVVSVGNCIPEKGFDFIIRSLGIIEKGLRPKLVIVSNRTEGTWKDYLTKLAHEHGVDMDIQKLVGDQDLLSFYNMAKLVVYAPYLEPFGLVPIEAMACGTPVVAVAEGGTKESVVDKETGILTSRSEGIFAQAVSDLLRDDKRRETMGRRAVDVVHGFWTLEQAGKRMLDHLNRAVAASDER
jgi:glycosyltransferase involved in cell wall biosynthesis